MTHAADHNLTNRATHAVHELGHGARRPKQARGPPGRGAPRARSGSRRAAGASPPPRAPGRAGPAAGSGSWSRWERPWTSGPPLASGERSVGTATLDAWHLSADARVSPSLPDAHSQPIYQDPPRFTTTKISCLVLSCLGVVPTGAPYRVEARPAG